MATPLLSKMLTPTASAGPREPMPVYRREDHPTDDLSDRELLIEAFHDAKEARFMIEQVLRSASTSPFLSKLLPKMD